MGCRDQTQVLRLSWQTHLPAEPSLQSVLFSFETKSYVAQTLYVAETGLELLILLLPHPKCQVTDVYHQVQLLNIVYRNVLNYSTLKKKT